MTDQGASLSMPEGGIEVTRSGPSISLPPALATEPALLAHPYCGLPAAIIHHWLGAATFHAGAVVIDGAAIAVFAPRGGGKSTLMAALARAGHDVLVDDVTIVADGNVQPGPRCVDLRQEASPFFEGTRLLFNANRERHRVALGPPPPATPLRGCVHLTWGAAHDVRPLPGGERLQALIESAALGLAPDDPTVHFDLAALPAWRVQRPKETLSESTLDHAVQVVTDLAALV